MRFTHLALGLFTAVTVTACGSVGADDLPGEETLAITAPDDTDDGASPLCSNGDAGYKSGLRAELEELNLATRPYRDLYRLARMVEKKEKRKDKLKQRRAERAGSTTEAEPEGSYDRTFSGPKGTITLSVDVAEDGSKTIQVTGQKKGDDDKIRLLFEGAVAADGLSGDWTVYGKNGDVWRTISWTQTAEGALTANWKNEKNGKTAVFTRDEPDAKLVVRKENGEGYDMTWNTETKAGSIVKVSSSGNEKSVCWDAQFCDVACAQ